MREFGDGGEKSPITPEDLKLVESGQGTPAQIVRVRKALADSDSPIYRSLGEVAASEKWFIIGQRCADRDDICSLAERNWHRVHGYLLKQREAGVLTQPQVNTLLISVHQAVPVMNAARVGFAAQYLMKAIIAQHPELAPEVRSLLLTPRER